MDVLIIGGTTGLTKPEERQKEEAILTDTMERLGSDLVTEGHKLLVCSVFSDSADIHVVEGAAKNHPDRKGSYLEFHCPRSQSLELRIAEVKDALTLKDAKLFTYFPLPEDPPENEEQRREWQYTYLYAQLRAMDRCHAIIAVGGRPTGSASLLLKCAESRGKFVLPLPFLGGAAAESFERIRYVLEDALQEEIALLTEAARTGEVTRALDRLTTTRAATKTRSERGAFFISYPRKRPQEADLIETILRRRGLEVFRDEKDFGAGPLFEHEITGYIHKANIFIAVWSAEYATSPWCFDELDLALKRQESGKTEVWLLVVDDTPIVPPAARELTATKTTTRAEIELRIKRLLDKALAD
jgi:hypothetical protein